MRRLFIGFINDFLSLKFRTLLNFLKADDYFVFFSRTGLVEGLDLLLAEVNFAVDAGRAPADGRTDSTQLLAPTVVAETGARAVTSIFVDGESVDGNQLGLERPLVDVSGLVDHEFSRLQIHLLVQAVGTPARFSAMS